MHSSWLANNPWLNIDTLLFHLLDTLFKEVRLYNKVVIVSPAVTAHATQT